MASYPRPSSLTSLTDINYVRRMSAPIAVRRLSPVSSAASSYTRRRSSVAECSLWDRHRRLSLVDNLSPRLVSCDSRKLSLVESSTATNSNSDSSIEIDTSSLSYDLVSSPRCETSCAGSYQPIPHDQLPECANTARPGLYTLISASRSVWRALMFGQLMALLLCVMSVCNYYLSTCHQIALPTGQSTLRYVLQCLTFTTWLSCRSGDHGIIHVLRCRGWRYMLLALVDVEANFLFILAHQFTTLTSIQLLDCVSIPAALALSCILLKVRYKIVHIVGVSVCLMGVGCLVWADVEDGRSLSGGKNQLLGDMLCLSGAVMFALVTVVQELVVKTLDWVEYLGMMGLLGSIYSILQTTVLERHTVLSVPWSNWQIVALLVGFGLAQFTFHVLAPVMLRETGATALQLSLLTADFYWLMLNVALLQYKFHALYFLSFTLTATGVMVYAVKRTPISSQSQQSAPYRDHSITIDMELVTPMSDLVSSSICPSRSTEMSAGSPDSQNFRLNGDALFY